MRHTGNLYFIQRLVIPVYCVISFCYAIFPVQTPFSSLVSCVLRSHTKFSANQKKSWTFLTFSVLVKTLHYVDFQAECCKICTRVNKATHTIRRRSQIKKIFRPLILFKNNSKSKALWYTVYCTVHHLRMKRIKRPHCVRANTDRKLE